MIEDMHPDICRVAWKFNRWHHHCDYKKFKNNKPILKIDETNLKNINNYSMILTKKN